MQNKKGIIIATIAVVLFVVVAFIFMYEPAREVFQKPQVKKHVEEITGDLPVLECNDENDKESYKTAITKKEINLCDCVDDLEQKQTCKSVVMDTSFYDKALAQLDESLCERIYSEIQKNACHLVVKSSVEQISKDNPQYIADVYAAAHNEDAIDYYRELIQKDAKNIKNFTSLALAYAEKGLKEQEQGMKQDVYVDKALEVIEQAKSVDKNNSEVYRIEAYINEIKPDYDKSMSLYDKAIELDKNNLFAYAGRGHLNRLRGSLMLAIEDFNKASELNVENDIVAIYSNLCTLEYSRSNQEESLKNCKTVAQMENIDAIFQSDALQIMTAIFVDNKDFAQAKNYILQAKTLTPSDPGVYVALSDLNLYEQQYKEAQDNAKTAIELSPTKTSSHLALSKALYMQEKYNESIVAARSGLSLVDNDVSLLVSEKPAMKRDLNYAIANDYRQLGNVEKQQRFEKIGQDAFESSNQLGITE